MSVFLASALDRTLFHVYGFNHGMNVYRHGICSLTHASCINECLQTYHPLSDSLPRHVANGSPRRDNHFTSLLLYQWMSLWFASVVSMNIYRHGILSLICFCCINECLQTWHPLSYLCLLWACIVSFVSFQSSNQCLGPWHQRNLQQNDPWACQHLLGLK